MIKTILLIFEALSTWEKIGKAQRGVLYIFLTFFLPLLLIVTSLEGFGMSRFGLYSPLLQRVVDPSLDLIIRYELIQVVLYILIVFLGARTLLKIALNFHSTHTYTQCFTVVAYTFGPYLLLRIPDGLTGFNTWICWGLGVALSIGVLYHGLPLVLQPDPTKTMGLFLLSSILFVLSTGLIHFLATLVAKGEVLSNIQITRLLAL